jgi:hypothetical protein
MNCGTRGALLARGFCVIRFLLLQSLNWLESPRLPSNMGNTCPLQSFSSNSTFIMLYLYHVMDIDYLVVDEMANISKLFDYTCMFSIGCKPIMITT